MILSPHSIQRHRLSSSSDILSARLNLLPSPNLSCDSHKQPAQNICFQNDCAAKVLCAQCSREHAAAHKSSLIPYQDFLGNDIIKKIDDEIVHNLFIQQKNEIYKKFQDQVHIALTEIRKRVDKTITMIYNSVKEKTLSHFVDPLYPTSEWEKLKKTLLEKKISLAKSSIENQVKNLDEYIKVYSAANMALIDTENTKDLKSNADIKDSVPHPELDPQKVDEAIKSLRTILNNLSSHISLQISPAFTPEENIQKAQSTTPYYKKFSLTVTPASPGFLRTPKQKLTYNIGEPSSGSSIPYGKDKVLDKSTSANGDMARVKSISPDELLLSPTRPGFLFDAYLDTEVINLPYIGPTKLEDGTVYRGQMKDGKKHGKGKVMWGDGKYYEGYFNEGFIEGKGRMVHADQDVYEGEWKKGKAHGKGKYEKADGWIYEGEWANDEPHGMGIEIWPDRSTYDGEYQNGAKHGRGTLIGPDGSCYCGEFRNNLFHGEGKYIWIDGRKYEGMWVKNVREGKGVMYYPDGKKYNGDFSNDKKHGFGRFDWGDGRKFVGYWREGKQHGQGKLFTKSGNIVDGEWREGKMIDNVVDVIQQSKSIKNIGSMKEKLELAVNREKRNLSLSIDKFQSRDLNSNKTQLLSIPQLVSPALSPIESKDSIMESFRQQIREPKETFSFDKEKEDQSNIVDPPKEKYLRERRSSIELNL